MKDSKSLFQSLENIQVKYVNKEQGSIWWGDHHQSTLSAKCHLHLPKSDSRLLVWVYSYEPGFERLWVKPEYLSTSRKPLSCWWVFPIISTGLFLPLARFRSPYPPGTSWVLSAICTRLSKTLVAKLDQLNSYLRYEKWLNKFLPWYPDLESV